MYIFCYFLYMLVSKCIENYTYLTFYLDDVKLENGAEGENRTRTSEETGF